MVPGVPLAVGIVDGQADRAETGTDTKPGAIYDT